MFTNGRKSGKHGAKPGKPDKDPQYDEELGSPYFYRHEKGGDERRMKELLDNNYKVGDNTSKDRNDAGFPVSPRRTIITGS